MHTLLVVGGQNMRSNIFYVDVAGGAEYAISRIITRGTFMYIFNMPSAPH